MAGQGANGRESGVYYSVDEHFESMSNTVMPSAVVFTPAACAGKESHPVCWRSP